MARHIHPSPFVIHPPADLVEKQPELRRMASQLTSRYAGDEIGGDKDLQTTGSALWQALALPLAEFDAAIAGAGAAILPIIIASSAPAVQALPWETLFHPLHGFIGRHPAFTLSRQLTPPALFSAVATLEKGPLRVLLFTSLPDDVDAESGRLKLEEEQAQVLEALLPWIAKGVVQLEMPDDGRFSTLQAMLKSFQPHVLFLSGHGCFQYEPHTGEAPYGAFFFESEVGDSEAVKQDEIARALVGSGVRAVVVSACESSKTTPASSALNHGLAQCISAQGVTYVIGMRESIYDAAGIAFARALCDELAGGERIDYALQAARIAIQTVFQPDAPYAQWGNAAAEPDYGQWCLPMLISANPSNALIDWHFQPAAIDRVRLVKTTLGEVKLPERFIGRRSEMRQYKNRLLKGELHSLLITGPGGQGKTSLGGKLALDMQRRGWQVFAWSAYPEYPWQEFLLKEVQMALDKARREQYDHSFATAVDEFEHAKFALKLLIEQFNGRVILFLDNLETLQDPDTLALRDAVVAAWLAAAAATPGVILIATSRWQLPDWRGAHLMLERANYGDFLQMAQRWQLPATFSEMRQLRQVYQVLGGNSRGLEFFAAAVKTMPDVADQWAFLEKLAQAKTDLQANMAIEAIVHHLSDAAWALLQRLPVYAEAVPLEGIVRLCPDQPEQAALVQELLAVSLLEAGYEPHWKVMQYQCSPLVADWLEQQGLLDQGGTYLNAAADYHVYLLAHGRGTLNQAIATHNALRRAGRDSEADRLALVAIVGPMTRGGLYATLLTEWLPRICAAKDDQIRAEALGQTGKLHLHLGNYDMAHGYLKQSLTIRQQIGDKKGEGAALHNISQILTAQGDYETALDYLKQVLTISRGIEDKAGEGTTLSNIATIYHDQDRYQLAIDYLAQALPIQQQSGNKVGEGATLGNLAASYCALGNFKLALDYLKQALEIQRDIGDKEGEGTTLNNIGQIFADQREDELAITYLKQSLNIRQQIDDKAGLCVTWFNFGGVYYRNNQRQEAVNAWVLAYTIAKQINFAQTLQALSDLAARLGLPGGLESWEQLAQDNQKGKKP